MRFSERMGIKPIKSKIQINSMDNELRSGLWNCLTFIYWENAGDTGFGGYSSKMKSLIEGIWLHHFKQPIDEIPFKWFDVYQILRKFFFDVASWDEVYDFIEFVSQSYNNDDANEKFIEACNKILEREVSAYRFVEGKITPITSETEIAAIEDAQETTKSRSLTPVHKHLETALSFLSDRKSPDYRNSIKESISAVEAMCRKITDNPRATLAEAIKKLKDSAVEIHPSLEKAFIAMCMDMQAIKVASVMRCWMSPT